MTADVIDIALPSQALENIPHMLRYWAQRIENEKEEGSTFAFAALILQDTKERTPTLAVFGVAHEDDLNFMQLAGALDACRGRIQYHAIED